MALEHRGSHEGAGLRFGIVVSRFNRTVTEKLLAGALKALADKGVDDDDVTVVHVPGAFEIPFFAARLADTGDFDAVITLGAIVRGETQHHDYLGHSVCQALGRLAVDAETPLTMGILTTDNMEQALRRAGDDPGNKGYESALGAIEIARLRAAME